MRKTNSMVSSTNAAGIGTSSHHSGMISVLIDSEPLARLLGDHANAVAHEEQAAHDAEDVADPFEQPADARRQRAQQDVDADVLASAAATRAPPAT